MAGPRTVPTCTGDARHRHQPTGTTGEDPAADLSTSITDMIESVGRRLRIVFARVRPGTPVADPSGATGPTGQELEFVAYAEDCLLSGQVRMSSDRLTDMLNEHDEYVLGDVLLERLDDGAGVELKEVLVTRDDLLLVHATGPRGNAERRHRTRAHPVAIKIGPYHLRGHLHGSPGRDPVQQLRRRKAMVPLTDASIEYRSGSMVQRRSVGVVVVNRGQIDWIVPAIDDQPAMPDLPELPADDDPGPLLKDFTGALFDL